MSTNVCSGPPRSSLFQQYSAIKEKHQDKLLLFQVGDFFELFYRDAERAAALINLTLTKRRNQGSVIPMAGVPVHASDTYVSRLVRLGETVAICEQIGTAAAPSGLFQRRVTRIITPGTLTEENLLSARESCIAMALAPSTLILGYAWLDLARGELRAGECPPAELAALIARLAPAELLLSEDQPVPAAVSGSVRHLPAWEFAPAAARERLLSRFKVADLSGFGLEQQELAATAAGALLNYAEQVQCRPLSHLRKIGAERSDRHLYLSPASRHSLELTVPITAGSPVLLSVLDCCRTAMGSRLLRWRLHNPIRDRPKLDLRQDAWQALARADGAREQVRRCLRNSCDVERIAARIALGTARPRELAALATLLANCKQLAQEIAVLAAPVRTRYQACEQGVPDALALITATLTEEPPAQANNGGVIKPGRSRDLDHLRALTSNLDDTLAAIEERERKTTGCASLKVGNNRVHGLYIELPRAAAAAAPATYRRRQTLKHGERYGTEELIDLERQISHAQSHALELERELYSSLLADLRPLVADLQQLSDALADLDLSAALAVIACERNWVRPTYAATAIIEIVDGRHPLVEQQGKYYVPNSTSLGSSTRIMILTGPNMGGKSTYMRQTALIVLIAQIGAPVPATSARLGMLDAIHTRIGAADDLAKGRSTFMVEMAETAEILNTASERSLILLDEIGRGTSTFDGLAIAWAVGEALARENRAMVMLATHFFELTALAEAHRETSNSHLTVGEHEGKAVMLYQVQPGPANRSFGIEVARMAGLPAATIERARLKLAELESSRVLAAPQATIFAPPKTPALPPSIEALLAKLGAADPDHLSPRDALALIYDLRKIADDS